MRPGGSATSRRMDSAVTLLPQPRLADDRQRLAALERERDAVDGLDDALSRIEVGLEVLHLEHALGRFLGRRDGVGKQRQATHL